MGRLRSVVTERLHNRRGATLVMIAIMMTVMIGMVGTSVDFARMYAFKAQLQVTADAAATAGAVELARSRYANVPTLAMQYARLNHVNGGDTAVVTNASVLPYHYDFATRDSFQTAGWTDAQTNAVKVIATYNAPYTFAKIFGMTSSALSGQAMAALAYVGATSCLKPWAVSYSAMLNSVPSLAGKDPATYKLSAADIQTLAANRTPITFLMDNADPVAPGNIAQVIVNDPWNGNFSYKDAITGACSNMPITPGVTWLNANAGQGAGQSTQSVQDLCGVKGNPATFSCNVPVKLAIWDRTNGLTGANLQFHVAYVGAFVVTGYSKEKVTGQGVVTKDAQITGYFTSMVTDGAISATPTPMFGKAALVL